MENNPAENVSCTCTPANGLCAYHALSMPACAECSRLASRVEQEHRIGELIRADKEAAENRVLELEWGLRNAVHELTSDYLQAGGDLAADTNPSLQYRNKLIERLAKLLAGAHAEERE